ncbi:MAG: hypothetical protein JW818_09710 [Pirellulales bacterium]|nr:hypothetical protein [Pirellulales bacterium]
MIDNLGGIAGCLIIFLLCAGTVWAIATRLQAHFKSGTAVDSTLSEVDRDNAPGLFWLQIVKLAIFLVITALIGLGALFMLFQQLAGGS